MVNSDIFNTPLVSVIVPIYNVEQFLEKCLDSICAQTYKNLEIILVDDGATDNSGKICDKYAENNPHIKVIHKKNGGLSDARNAGLELCKGGYITFIDGDDYVSHDYVEKLYNALIKYNTDISVCAEQYVQYNENGEDTVMKRPFKDCDGELVMTAEEALDNFIRQNMFDASACAKLYKAKCFEEIRFPCGYAYEDVGTIYKPFLKSKSVVFFSDRLYFYLQRQGSILHTNSDSKRYWDGVKMAENQYSDVMKQWPQLKKAVECRCLSMYFHAFIGAHSTNDSELKKYAWNKIKELRFRVLFDNKGRPKARAAALLSLFGQNFFIKANNIFN